jgi:hypothetical protein
MQLNHCKIDLINMVDNIWKPPKNEKGTVKLLAIGY